jgi:hypothetical protein
LAHGAIVAPRRTLHIGPRVDLDCRLLEAGTTPNVT